MGDYPVKVLLIPNYHGENVGDNWQLASFGYDEEVSANVYLTTNGVRCSEYGQWDEIEAANMAKICAEAVNAKIKGSDAQARIAAALELLDAQRDLLRSWAAQGVMVSPASLDAIRAALTGETEA